MKSRITIEVDFSNNNSPVVQVLFRKSDDVRDNLIQTFLQSLGHTSSWCRIEWRQHVIDHNNSDNDFQRVFITPLRPTDLKENAKIMTEQATWYDAVPQQDSVSH